MIPPDVFESECSTIRRMLALFRYDALFAKSNHLTDSMHLQACSGRRRLTKKNKGKKRNNVRAAEDVQDAMPCHEESSWESTSDDEAARSLSEEASVQEISMSDDIA